MPQNNKGALESFVRKYVTIVGESSPMWDTRHKNVPWHSLYEVKVKEWKNEEKKKWEWLKLEHYQSRKLNSKWKISATGTPLLEMKGTLGDCQVRCSQQEGEKLMAKNRLNRLNMSGVAPKELIVAKELISVISLKYRQKQGTNSDFAGINSNPQEPG